nr:MAG TPA: hypothetical protein [Bacteriophage sp.]
MRETIAKQVRITVQRRSHLPQHDRDLKPSGSAVADGFIV